LYFYRTNVVFNGFKSEIAQILIKTIRTIKNLDIHIDHKDSICNDFSIEYMDVIEGLFISNMSTRLVRNVCLESLFRNVGAYYESDVGCRCTHIKFTNKNIIGDTDDLLGLEVENSRFVLDLKLISKGITKYCNEPIYELILDYNRIEYTYGFEQLCEYCLDSSLFTSDVFRYLSVRDKFDEVNKAFKYLSFTQSGLSQVFVLLPFILLMPLYISKTITMGAFFQSVNALGKIVDSLSVIIDNRTLLVNIETCLLRIKFFTEVLK
jgi:hypothetical protein